MPRTGSNEVERRLKKLRSIYGFQNADRPGHIYSNDEILSYLLLMALSVINGE